MLGSVLGNYRVLEPLGEGGMGVVYLGRHEKLGQRVVVKVLRPEMSSHADMVQRFFNEAQAATAIHDPGIAQVFDVGTTRDGRAYFVMELLKGETLAARLKQGPGRLDAEACCRIGRQIANVLAAAHAAGITHRDLKPDNLFLVPDAEVIGGERVKVLDFGIAKLAGDTSGVQTRLGVAMGTPRYMAPEQCSNASAADARSDIYALGCVLFRVACGRPPFVEKDLVDLVNAQLCDPPPDPLRFAPELPPALARLILQMLEKAPDARPQTMAEVRRELDEIAAARGRRSEKRTAELRPPRSADEQVTTPTARALPAPERSTEVELPRPPELARSAAATPRSLPLPAAPELSTAAPLPLPLPPELPGGGAPPAPLRATPESSAAVTLPAPAMARASSTLAAPRSGERASGALTAASGDGAGVAAGPSRWPAARWPAVLGGFAVLGAALGITVVLAGGGARGAGSQVAYGEQAAPRRAGAIRVEPIEPAPAGPAGAPAAPVGEPSAPEAPAAARGPRRAAELGARAAEEARSAPRIAAADAALRDNRLQRAWTELAQVWPGAAAYPALRRRYDLAEARAIDELAARLERAMTPDCEAYAQLLAQARAAGPGRVAEEAARRTGCTPRPCDADALADAGQAHFVTSRLAEALAAYEAAYACRPDPRWAEKSLLIACNLADLAKSRLYWSRLPAILQPRVVGICERNGIAREALDAP